MSRYRKVDPKMWSDAKFRALTPPPPCGQSLWTYLLTCPEASSLPGLFRAGRAQLAEALGWSSEGFAKAFAEVSSQGLAEADWEARVVWLPNAKRYNAPESPNVVTSWRAHWDEVPECPLKVKAWGELRAFAEALGEPFLKAFLKACQKPSPKTMANQDPDPDPDQEQDPDVCSERSASAESSSPPAKVDKPNDPRREVRRDIDPAILPPRELAAYQAIVGDESLRPIVRYPAQLAIDLCSAGPGVDVALQCRKAGAWLRANPTRAKKNGARFLLGWIEREQESRGGRSSQESPPSVVPAYPQHRPLEVPARMTQSELKASAEASKQAKLQLDALMGEMPNG